MKKLLNNLAILSLAIVLLAGGVFFYFFTHKPLVSKSYSHDKTKLSPVVRLTTPDGRTFCSGVVVSENTVITAGHCVVEQSFLGYLVRQGIEVRAVDGIGRDITTRTTYLSPQMDTATLTGDFSAFEARAVITDIAKLTEAAQTKTIFTSCGYPLGGDIYCSKTQYVGRINFMWLVTGVLLPGMSGGPTMLDDGTVIAINDAVEGEFSIVAPVYNVPVK